jgi:hypothetical protein
MPAAAAKTASFDFQEGCMDLLNDLIKTLGATNGKVLFLLSLNLLGFVLKYFPRIPNQVIPLTLMAVGAAVFPFVSDSKASDPSMHYPVAHLIMQGFVLGFFAWIAHDKVLRYAEKFLPDGFFKDPNNQTPPPPNNMIKVLFGFLIAGSLMLAGSGCAIFKQPAGTDPAAATALKVRRVAAIARGAAFDGAVIEIAQRPGDRAYFVAAKIELDDLLSSQNYDPVAFRAAILKLPIKELRSPVGAIVVNNAIEVFDELQAEHVDLSGVVWLAPVITAVRDGFQKALDQTATP